MGNIPACFISLVPTDIAFIILCLALAGIAIVTLVKGRKKGTSKTESWLYGIFSASILVIVIGLVSLWLCGAYFSTHNLYILPLGKYSAQFGYLVIVVEIAIFILALWWFTSRKKK